jgi:hypothetical protein
MKNKFKYNTCLEAMDALVLSLKTDFKWESIEEVDFWLREFLRNKRNDNDYLNTVINMIGHDYWAIKQWFFIQESNKALWKNKSFSLIELWAAEFRGAEY